MRQSTRTSKRKRATSPAAEVPAAAETNAVIEPAPAAADAVGSDATVTLPSVCSIKDAATLKSTLSPLLEHADPVGLDARAVERMDTAIFQLLLAFVRGRTERNLAVEWLGVPASVIAAASLLGLRELLHLPEEATGAAT